MIREKSFYHSCFTCLSVLVRGILFSRYCERCIASLSSYRKKWQSLLFYTQQENLYEICKYIDLILRNPSFSSSQSSLSLSIQITTFSFLIYSLNSFSFIDFSPFFLSLYKKTLVFFLSWFWYSQPPHQFNFSDTQVLKTDNHRWPCFGFCDKRASPRPPFKRIFLNEFCSLWFSCSAFLSLLQHMLVSKGNLPLNPG